MTGPTALETHRALLLNVARGDTTMTAVAQWALDREARLSRNSYNAALESACGALAAVAIEANRPECCDSAAYDRGECCGNPNLLVTASDVAQAIRALAASVTDAEGA